MIPSHPSLRSHEPGTRIGIRSSQQDVLSRGRQDHAVTSKRSSLVTVADPFNTGPGESKAFSNRHSIDMVSALHGVHEAKCSGTASNSIPNSEQTHFEFTHFVLCVGIKRGRDSKRYLPSSTVCDGVYLVWYAKSRSALQYPR